MNHIIRSLFRSRLVLLMAAMAAVSVPAAAQLGGMTCTVAGTPIPLRAGGGAERLSDLVLTCTGGTPTGAGQSILPMDITVTFSANVTSRLLSPGWVEALLVVDEPIPSSQLACTTVDGYCPLVGTGTGTGTYNGASGRVNVFQGSLSTANSITWRIPLDPPGSGQRRLRFTNLRAVADSVEGTQVNARVTMSGQLPVTVPSNLLPLGVSQAPLSVSTASISSVDGQLTKFSIVLQETSPLVLKAFSSNGPGPATQAGPGGAPLDYETGFYNPGLAGSIRGALTLAGLPSSGTRVRIRLSAIPSGVTVSVPQAINIGATGVARLVSTDLNGIGSFNPSPSGVLTNDGGIVTAVYEILQASATTSEVLQVPFSLSYATGAPLLPTVNGDVALAPLSPSQTADNFSPIPRFSSAGTNFNITEPLRITTSSLLSGVVGSSYTQAIKATGGVAPYAFSITGGSLPPGLTMSVDGSVTGVPNTAGTYRVTVTVRDAVEQTATATLSARILATPPILTSETKVGFTVPQSGNPPPARTVLVTASQIAQGYTVTVDAGTDGSSAPAWIQVSPQAGLMPALLTIKVDQGDLPPDTYTARIRVFSAGNSNLETDLPVTMTVAAAPAKLGGTPALLKLDTRVTIPEKKSGYILLRNTGGGGAIRFSASVVQGSRWITTVSPATAFAGPKNSGQVRVDVDSTGLQQGEYRDVVRFASDAGNVDVPVILRVTPAGALLDVSRSGFRFSMQEGAATPQLRDVRILNRDASTTLQWSADLLRGSEYFTLSATSGSASQATPGTLRIGVRSTTASLAPGTYSGIVRVTSPSAAYSPRYITLVLNVRGASQPTIVDLDPGGVVLTGPARSFNTLTRTVLLNVPSSSGITFQAGASASDGGDWLTITPTAGSASSARTETMTVAVNPRNLSAGVYTGEITVATADDSDTLSVTVILTDSAADAAPVAARAAACVPNKLVIGSTGLANNFTVPAGWPAAVSVEVRDNCGTAMPSAAVVARFTNGDPPLPLAAEGTTGTFSATWQPGTALAQTNVTIDATSADLGGSSITLVGGVTANAAPKLFRNGTIHNLDPKLGGLLAPGLVVQIYGEALAGVAESTGSVPLAKTYKGTTVLIGPYEAPLYYVSPGQLVAQLPSELPPNTSYPILVVANNQVTVPDEVDVVSIQPGVAAFADGTLIAQHSNFALVTPSNPAKRNEPLVMYLVGMGATNPSVASGNPSPGVAPLGVPLVQPQVTIGGTSAAVAFYGLTPFGVGLYQINFTVPANAPVNVPLQVLVKQGDYTANLTTLTVSQ